MRITKKQKYLQNAINSFVYGNCEEVLKQIPNESVDLVVTSPPYADQRDYGSLESSISPDQYVKWFAPKAKEIHRVLKNNGSFVLNINDKVVGGYQHLFVFELVLHLCKKTGFNLVRDYIWYNPATPPNVFSRGGYGRTKKSHEYCFWFSKGPEWTFNLDPIRKPYGKDMLKFLEGKGKGDRNQNTRPSTHNFNCEKVWTNKGGSDPGSVIELGNTNSNDVFAKLCKERGISHPARFPEKLVEFFILSGTKVGDVVLDPFSGSGTTAISAERNGRKWIGIDGNADYCELAAARMEIEFGGESRGD
ncbi:site-specific DNA-methyltransferase [Paenibacillus sp. FSL M8-0212]|uniref:DNA-methyltransferase n=1 Tax=Paenibacillus sp. FSL M8-0212 TaxID=2921618 RepID=UPI0030F9A931